MGSLDTLFAPFDDRRSVYSLSNESTVPDSKIEDIVKKVLLTTPSAFNTQSTRIVVLHQDSHRKLWDIVEDVITPLAPENARAGLKGKINGFRNSYATVLFFEDPSSYDHLSAFKMYADKFGSWRDQTSGMHQLLVWTALEAEGLAANLQHYNPAVDDQVKSAFKLDAGWTLIAQMVIGKPVAERPSAKDKKPDADRYKILS